MKLLIQCHCIQVEATACVVANLCSYKQLMGKNTDGKLFVVDAGDGKGYLSSRLALEHNLKVLGIDASATNTNGAQKRVSKLQVRVINLSLHGHKLITK